MSGYRAPTASARRSMHRLTPTTLLLATSLASIGCVKPSNIEPAGTESSTAAPTGAAASGAAPTPAATKSAAPTDTAAPEAELREAASTAAAAAEEKSFAQTRAGQRTRLTKRLADGAPAEPPPRRAPFELVKYPSPAGPLAAYVSKVPAREKDAKHPAVVWIFGGFDNGIGGAAWERQSAANDQSAKAFREAGAVMMYPSLRGGNDNPGHVEAFFGEIDDVLAAADWLAARPEVDPGRIYLGGHSTGGTLALLAAAADDKDRFRAVFALGAVDDPRGYGAEVLPYDSRDQRESSLRAPANWLGSIAAPTFVFEGAGGNTDSLAALKARSDNPQLHFFVIPGRDHFDVIDPLTRMLAAKVAADTGPEPAIAVTAAEVRKLGR